MVKDMDVWQKMERIERLRLEWYQEDLEMLPEDGTKDCTLDPEAVRRMDIKKGVFENLLKEVIDEIGACPRTNDSLGYDASKHTAYYRTPLGYYWSILCRNFVPFSDLWTEDADSGSFRVIRYSEVPTRLNRIPSEVQKLRREILD
jgi:hypothetical protein